MRGNALLENCYMNRLYLRHGTAASMKCCADASSSFEHSTLNRALLWFCRRTILLTSIVLTGIGLLLMDSLDNMNRLQSVSGLLTIIFVGYLFSQNRDMVGLAPLHSLKEKSGPQCCSHEENNTLSLLKVTERLLEETYHLIPSVKGNDAGHLSRLPRGVQHFLTVSMRKTACHIGCSSPIRL